MLLIVLGIVILLVIIFVVMYNGFIRLKNNCDEAFATMDVYLKKRYDLIPNLVETVKGYAAHESQTLEKVIAARNMAQNATSPEAKIAGENVLQSGSESKPELPGAVRSAPGDRGRYRKLPQVLQCCGQTVQYEM